jgi:hypothetical protein
MWMGLIPFIEGQKGTRQGMGTALSVLGLGHSCPWTLSPWSSGCELGLDGTNGFVVL